METRIFVNVFFDTISKKNKKHNRWPQIGQISTGVNVSGNSS